MAPHKALQTERVDTLAVGAGAMVGNGCPLGTDTPPLLPVWPPTRSISAVKTSLLSRLERFL